MLSRMKLIAAAGAAGLAALLLSRGGGGAVGLGHLSPAGLAFIKSREGYSASKYWDYQQYSIGYGSHWLPGMPTTITESQASALLLEQLQTYMSAVEAGLKVPQSQHQWDALISICYNIGTAGFAGSTFLKRINAGSPIQAICEAIAWWNKPAVIIGRRNKEIALYRYGAY